MNDSTKISPRYRVADYRSLNLTTYQRVTSDWVTATEIFRDRIQGRFVDPIDFILREEREAGTPEDLRTCGFTVMAIDCLLMETLQAFRIGWTTTQGIENSRKTRADGKRFLISEFLTEREGFKDDFCESRARKFSEQIRNGLLHYAETLGDSIIKSEGPLVSEHGNGLRINRTLCHGKLRAEVTRYVDEVLMPRESGLRENLRRKLDDICDPA